MDVETAFTKFVGKPQPHGRETDYDCPFCFSRGSEMQGHLHVNFDKGKALCHKCDYRSKNLLNIVRDVCGTLPKSLLLNGDGKEWFQEVKALLEAPNGNGNGKGRRNGKLKCVKLPKQFIRLTLPAKDPYAKVMYAALRRRKVTDTQIDDLGVGYAIHGRYEGMLIFPIYILGKLRYYVTRRVLGFGPKTLHPMLPRAPIIFNYDQAAMKRRIVVTEGPFDALAFWRGGVAILGTYMSPEQARLLARTHAEEIVICLDADVSGNHTTKMAEFLDKHVDARVSYMLLDEGDPDENRPKLKKLLTERQPWDFAAKISKLFS